MTADVQLKVAIPTHSCLGPIRRQDFFLTFTFMSIHRLTSSRWYANKKTALHLNITLVPKVQSVRNDGSRSFAAITNEILLQQQRTFMKRDASLLSRKRRHRRWNSASLSVASVINDHRMNRPRFWLLTRIFKERSYCSAHFTSSHLISSQLTFHLNWVHSDGEPGHFTAHDPVRRGCDQSRCTQFGWNEVS